jgi:DNA-binding SARP family transcriptional activator
MVVVRLPGPVDVVDGAGNVWPPASPIRRTLLALLALRPGEVVSGDWLLDHAWNAEPPESGLRAARFHISQLRQELGVDDLIETRQGGISTGSRGRPGRCAGGREDGFSRLPARRSSGRSGQVGRRARPVAWHAIVDAAPCSALDDEAGRLEEVRWTILEDQFRLRLEAGAGRELVADLSRATARQPLRESLWSSLITAQYRRVA